MASTYKKKAVPCAVRRGLVQRAGLKHGDGWTPVKCHYCDFVGHLAWSGTWGWPSMSDLQMDHVIPEREGGESTVDNMVLACGVCNRSRGHRREAHSRVGYNAVTGEGRQGRVL